METFKDRLLLEYKELLEKTVKLKDFLNSDKFESIDGAQKPLLQIQLKAMDTYSQCLFERIALLE